jgi:hypothetical protein
MGCLSRIGLSEEVRAPYLPHDLYGCVEVCAG